MYDKLFSAGPEEWKVNLRERAADTTVLIADTVAQHYANSHQAEYPPSAFGCCRPPFDVAFVEWNNPSAIWIDGKIIPQEQSQSAVMCLTRPFDQAARKAFSRSLREGLSESDSREFEAKIVDAEILVLAKTAAFLRGRVIAPPHDGIWLLDGQGRVLNWLMQGDDIAFHVCVQQADEAGTSYGAEFFHVVWLAFSFCHCKNVKTVDVTADVEPLPKTKRRLKIPTVRRVTLEIGGEVVRPTREYAPTPAGDAATAFHLCRGHFAEYTADKPLFGNPKLVGKFWHPPHTRGKKEHGEVIKDYVTGSTDKVARGAESE
jgi:hypothetical protein